MPEEFLKAVSVASFFMNILNYQENLTQNDKADILQWSQDISDAIVNRIEQHLEKQDKKLDLILEKLDLLLEENGKN